MATNLSQTTGRKSATEQFQEIAEKVKSAVGFGAEGMDRTMVPPKSAPEKSLAKLVCFANDVPVKI